MSNKIEYFATLPVDTLRDIMRLMDVVSAQKLRDVCKDKARYQLVLSECDRRLSQITYLDENFGHGKKFMQAMSICGACVVGPRATEFFVPSRISENSSWDISMNYNDGNAFEFVDRMKAIGVVWITPKNEVRNLFMNGAGDITMDKFKYAYVLRYIKELSNEMGYHLMDTVNLTIATRVRICVHDDIVSVHDAASSNDSLVRESVWMCIGYITSKSSTMTIRLSGERDRLMSYYPKAFINNHSSCLQALIGPYFSCHLYGKLTTNMKTYAWPNNVITPPPIYDEQDKDLEQEHIRLIPEWTYLSEIGFEYERVPQAFMFGRERAVLDDESIWLDREADYGEDSINVSRCVGLLKRLRLSQGQLGLSSSTVSKIPLGELQPWKKFEKRRYKVSHTATGIYIPSLWSYLFGQPV
jgi:hypothetical protein